MNNQPVQKDDGGSVPSAQPTGMSGHTDGKPSLKDYFLALVPVLVTGALLAFVLMNTFGEDLDAERHERFAREYFDNGDYQNAVLEYDEVIKAHPRNLEAHYRRGRAHLYLHNYDEAISDLSFCLERWHYVNYIHTERCWAYYKRGDYAKALVDCNNALEISPQYAPAHYNIGLVYKALGRVGDAISAFELAVEYSNDESLTLDAEHELELLNAR